MLMLFCTGQLSATQQIVDTQAVTDSCVLVRASKSGFLETEDRSAGLEAFPSSFPPPFRDWSLELGFKHCALSRISICSMFPSILWCSLIYSCAVPVRFASWSLGYEGAELLELG